jgi:hypothetical protein
MARPYIYRRRSNVGRPRPYLPFAPHLCHFDPYLWQLDPEYLPGL